MRPQDRKTLWAAAPALLLLAACGEQRPGVADESGSVELRSPAVSPNVHSDVSPPLGLIRSVPRQDEEREHPVKPIPRRFNPGANDPVRQSSITPLLIPAPSTNFDGVGQGFTGPAGTFTVNSAPPDTNGDVGPNHYVQIVNTDFAVFSKTGTALFGPVPINTLWSGFGGGCQNNSDGDPVVLYDPMADRWVISQFSVTTQPFLQCVAVSTTSDPTGPYARYSFQYSNFPDYPKMGVWPDAYYQTFNLFNAAGTQFFGSQVCAYDRAKMLAGQPATQQCFTTSSSFGGLLPADLDGARLPPAGEPNWIVGLGANPNQLAFWRFHVDFATPGNTTFTGPSTLATAAFSEACSGGTCIPQSGTTQRLDSLADRLMFRLAYRNLGDHEALVVNHSVTAGSSTGVRWYELRVSGGTSLSIFQQGTYAPDSNFRWMGSAAMDQAGNIALGFSVSSSSVHPQIHYTGRLAGDALGQMTQGEGTIIDGAGSQTGSNLSRWGDYSMMAVDPTDDCTFWYTTEYIPSNGAFNWKTRIGSFKFPGCGGPVPDDFSIGASPASQTVQQGASTTYNVSTSVTSGNPQTVNLSVSGLPAGATGTFNPASVTAGGSSVLTVNTSSSTPAGTSTLTITGTGTSATHSTMVTLVVNGPPPPNGIVNGGFESGLTGWTIVGAATTSATAHSGAASAMVGSASPFNGDSSVAQTFTAPSAGGTLTFWYQPHCTDTVTYDWALATLKDNLTGVTSTLLPRTCANNSLWTQVSYDLTSNAGHSVTLTLLDHDDNFAADPTYTLYDDVSIGSGNDFSISASPASLSVQQGSSGSSTISTAVTSGSAQTISLTATGQPSDVTVVFNPTSVSAGQSSTMSVTASSGAATGNYTINVTGTAISGSHTTPVALMVTPLPNDFSISASPASLSIQQGSSGSSTISTAVTSGSAQTISLSATGQPSGVTVVFNPASVLAGQSSTMNVTVSSGAATGNSTITVTGTASSGSHTTPVALTVTATPPPGGGIVNGDFETGNFTGWTASGASETVISAGCHGGAFCAQLGSTSATNGDSSIAQTFTAPSGATGLSLWYKETCPDTVTFDWALVTLADNTAGSTATLLQRTCATNNWTQLTGSLTAGHSYTLTLTSHDDNFGSDPTYTLYDDVSITTGAPPPPPPVGIVNGGFETGNLTGWTSSGASETVISSGCHAGTYCAQLGNSSATNGDSSIAQTFTAPTSTSQLSIWYASHCPDTVTFDWVTITLADNTAGTTTTVLPRTCASSFAWTNVTAGVTAGHSYTLTITSHDDNFSADPTYTLADDVTLN